MAMRVLGHAITAAGVEATIYTAPADKTAVVNINVCNVSSASASVNIKIGSEYIEYNTTLPASGVLERTIIVVDNNEAITALTSDVCHIRIYGAEE